jgi:hypothetical protein
LARVGALLALLAPSVSHAQIWMPWTDPFAPLSDDIHRGKQAPFHRLRVGAYLALWENPFLVDVPYTDPDLNPMTRTFRLVPDTPPSPLIEATYRLNRRWSVGLWYNPIRGEQLRATVRVAGQARRLELERDADLADLHLLYTGPGGLSAQLGYYRERDRIRQRTTQGVIPIDDTLVSWNFWVAQQLTARLRGCRLTPYVSMGYHAGADLGDAVSFQGGVALEISQRLKLSGSVWLFDLSHTATRVTSGLAYEF